jgi:hypothetical protein
LTECPSPRHPQGDMAEWLSLVRRNGVAADADQRDLSLGGERRGSVRRMHWPSSFSLVK